MSICNRRLICLQFSAKWDLFDYLIVWAIKAHLKEQNLQKHNVVIVVCTYYLIQDIVLCGGLIKDMHNYKKCVKCSKIAWDFKTVTTFV